MTQIWLECHECGNIQCLGKTPKEKEESGNTVYICEICGEREFILFIQPKEAPKMIMNIEQTNLNHFILQKEMKGLKGSE